MSRALTALDRVVVLLLGLALLALGLLALDWRGGWVLTGLPERLSTGGAEDVVDSAWWPWVFAVVGVVLGLLGVRWLLAHVRGPSSGTLRTAASDQTGRVEADLRSVADAVAARFERTAPVTGAAGRVRRLGGGVSTVEVRAHVEPQADAASLVAAVETCAREVEQAFPEDRVACRVLLSSPSRAGRAGTKARRRSTVRVPG